MVPIDRLSRECLQQITPLRNILVSVSESFCSLTVDSFEKECSDILVGLVYGAVELLGRDPVETSDLSLELEVFLLVS